MTYRRARSLQSLHEQINSAYPGRDTASDGWIGDTRHSRRRSDHNPDENGIVHAIDVDEDNTVGDQKVGRDLWAWLLRVKPDWVKYAIYEGEIVSSYPHPDRGDPWNPGPYSGWNPHDKHVHISVYDDQPFSGPRFSRGEVMADNWIDDRYPDWVHDNESAKKMVKAVFTKYTDPSEPLGEMRLLNAVAIFLRLIRFALKG